MLQTFYRQTTEGSDRKKKRWIGEELEGVRSNDENTHVSLELIIKESRVNTLVSCAILVDLKCADCIYWCQWPPIDSTLNEARAKPSPSTTPFSLCRSYSLCLYPPPPSPSRTLFTPFHRPFFVFLLLLATCSPQIRNTPFFLPLSSSVRLFWLELVHFPTTLFSTYTSLLPPPPLALLPSPPLLSVPSFYCSPYLITSSISLHQLP